MRRKRYLVAAGAVALLAAGGAVAFADSDDVSAAAVDTRSAHAVRLPTGDTVTLSPSGSLVWHPGEGREDVGLMMPRALDGSGDVIAVPSDVVDDVVSGDQDPRRYNVSELLRAGETDAASARSLSDKDYDGLVPVGDQPDFDAADARKVTITFTGANGEPVGQDASGVFIDDETAEAGFFEFDEAGKATVSLPPGTYNIAMSSLNVLGAKTITVADDDVNVTMDGTRSQAIEHHVDQPAKLVEQSVAINLERNGDLPGGVSVTAPPDHGLRVIPTGEDDKGINFESKPKLKGEGHNPVRYNLSFINRDGIPGDPSFTAHDEDLAKVTRHYDGIASDVPASGCHNALHDDGSPIASCGGRDLEIPGERTEYFTADAKVRWFANTSHMKVDDQNYLVADFESSDRYQPGPAERSSVHGPLGLYLGTPGERVLRREGDQIAVQLPFLENSAPEMVAPLLGADGKVTMAKDGQQVGKAALPDGVGSFRLPDKDSGRYTLTAQVGHDGTITPLATKTAVTWEFDSKFTDTSTPLPVSAVNLKPEGVSNGYAEAAKKQKFALDFVAQDGATDTDVKDLTFEVSYDDGQTWKKVDVSVDGDSATGRLKHPDGAAFVSVRASATDADGNKVTQSTLRAYGLK